MNQPIPTPPPSFQLCEGYASYAPAGEVSITTAVNLISAGIIFARDRQVRRLLIDASQLTGFPSPSVADRYWIVRQWAEDSRNLVEVAVVLQRHIIDPGRFGVHVAINLGMRADVFDSKSEALSWLLSGARPHTTPHH